MKDRRVCSDVAAVASIDILHLKQLLSKYETLL